MASVELLFEGDKRCEALLGAIKSTVYERGLGLPLPSVVGVLELAKIEILKEQDDE